MQQRFAQEIEPAEVEGPLQTHGLEVLQVLGAEKETVGKPGLLAGGQVLHRGVEAGHHGSGQLFGLWIQGLAQVENGLGRRAVGTMAVRK